MPGPAIRPATRDDIPEILEIYSPFVTETAVSFEYDAPTVESMEKRLADVQEHGVWLVAEISGRVAGYAYSTMFRSRRAYDRTSETTVYVSEEHRGSGVARALMTALLDELRQLGTHVAVAVITVPNEASERLHQSLGFTPVGTFTEIGHKFDRWHDVAFWQVVLDDAQAAPGRA